MEDGIVVVRRETKVLVEGRFIERDGFLEVVLLQANSQIILKLGFLTTVLLLHFFGFVVGGDGGGNRRL